MPTQRAIRGVLGNFLGTYTSRYSEHGGYWLFGLVVEELGELEVDLLADPDDGSGTAFHVLINSAAVGFADQIRKARLVPGQVHEAWLTIRKQPGVVHKSVSNIPRVGHNVSFSAVAVMADGRKYEREQVVFVAPHDPVVELWSPRPADRFGSSEHPPGS